MRKAGIGPATWSGSGAALLCALPFLLGAPPAKAQPRPDAAGFHLQEATIDSIHAEMRAGRLTCVRLVQAYLDRIAAYDQKGPTLNAVQNVNPDALKIAAELDARFRATGQLTGPLHCITVLIKDEVNTSFMPTTYGSAVFKSFVPQKSATIVTRLQSAGAIILGKANMGEFAQGYSGSAFGDCHNAYDPRRSPSGSSCGTAVGIAANFATIGIGADTAGSIRGPASHGSLVGLRPTLPLVSRAGIMPYDPSRDTLGPITRTVRDAAIVLDVIAGYDPEDPVTAWAYGQQPKTYTADLTPTALSGMRFGVIRVPMSRDADVNAADYKEIQTAISGAAATLKAQGAEVIDPLTIPNLKEMVAAVGAEGRDTEAAIDAFLAQQPNTPVRTLKDIVASELVIPKRREELGRGLGRTADDAAALRAAKAREDLRLAILRVMADNRLDALVYATYDHAPTPVPISTPGTNRVLAAAVSFPALAVPAGYFADGLPIGLELLGRPYSENALLKAAYGYEQATHYRHAPTTVPALPQEP
jgi:Asp-tRNA(Asn)/Glu-tRNA(Gln) amidotransferase A subunit family amidase